MIRVTGSTSEIVFEALPVDDPQIRQPDITRAKQVLGWEPEVELEEGLRTDAVTSAEPVACVGRWPRGGSLLCSQGWPRRRLSPPAGSSSASSTSSRRSGDPDWAFPQYKSLGVEALRVNLLLGRPERRRAQEAPANASTRPIPPTTGRSTTRWSSARRDNGIKVRLLDRLDTPALGNGPARTALPTKMIDLRNFAFAAAKRYSGSFHPDSRRPAAAGRAALARLERAEQPGLPEAAVHKSRKGKKRLARARASTPGSATRSVRRPPRRALAARRSACGATAPRGNNTGTQPRPSVSPLIFLRGAEARARSASTSTRTIRTTSTRTSRRRKPPRRAARRSRSATSTS